MNECITIDTALSSSPICLLDKNESISTVQINKAQDLTINVISKGGKGLVVFDLKRPEMVTPSPEIIEMPTGKPSQIPAPVHSGRTPLPHAVELESGSGITFVLDGLYSGDRITIAKSLREGEAYVEAADTVEATPDNCKAYEKALGITVTPHPIWRLPRITNAPSNNQKC